MRAPLIDATPSATRYRPVLTVGRFPSSWRRAALLPDGRDPLGIRFLPASGLRAGANGIVRHGALGRDFHPALGEVWRSPQITFRSYEGKEARSVVRSSSNLNGFRIKLWICAEFIVPSIISLL